MLYRKAQYKNFRILMLLCSLLSNATHLSNDPHKKESANGNAR